jgi:hypothetical protein
MGPEHFSEKWGLQIAQKKADKRFLSANSVFLILILLLGVPKRIFWRLGNPPLPTRLEFFKFGYK